MEKLSFVVFLKSTRLQDNETTSRDVSLFPKYKHTMKRLFLIRSYLLSQRRSVSQRFFHYFFALLRAFA